MRRLTLILTIIALVLNFTMLAVFAEEADAEACDVCTEEEACEDCADDDNGEDDGKDEGDNDEDCDEDCEDECCAEADEIPERLPFVGSGGNIVYTIPYIMVWEALEEAVQAGDDYAFLELDDWTGTVICNAALAEIAYVGITMKLQLPNGIVITIEPEDITRDAVTTDLNVTLVPVNYEMSDELNGWGRWNPDWEECPCRSCQGLDYCPDCFDADCWGECQWDNWSYEMVIPWSGEVVTVDVNFDWDAYNEEYNKHFCGGCHEWLSNCQNHFECNNERPDWLPWEAYHAYFYWGYDDDTWEWAFGHYDWDNFDWDVYWAEYDAYWDGYNAYWEPIWAEQNRYWEEYWSNWVDPYRYEYGYEFCEERGVRYFYRTILIETNEVEWESAWWQGNIVAIVVAAEGFLGFTFTFDISEEVMASADIFPWGTYVGLIQVASDLSGVMDERGVLVNADRSVTIDISYGANLILQSWWWENWIYEYAEEDMMWARDDGEAVNDAAAMPAMTTVGSANMLATEVNPASGGGDMGGGGFGTSRGGIPGRGTYSGSAGDFVTGDNAGTSTGAAADPDDVNPATGAGIPLVSLLIASGVAIAAKRRK
jgi:hypothetical protein